MQLDQPVFINCPLDNDYWEMLRALTFTVAFIGFRPTLAPQNSDSATVRLTKILELIENAVIGIHDLSLVKTNSPTEYCRMNMPFELGLDISARYFGKDELRSKPILVLEKEKYGYQKALSDLAGCDIKCHSGNPMTLVKVVREWFIESVPSSRNLPGPTEIWNRYNDFMWDLHQKCLTTGFSEDDFNQISIAEYIDFLLAWIAEQRLVTDTKVKPTLSMVP